MLFPGQVLKDKNGVPVFGKDKNSSKKKTEKVKTDAEDSSKISPAEGLF
jgi:hypothetical protein